MTRFVVERFLTFRTRFGCPPKLPIVNAVMTPNCDLPARLKVSLLLIFLAGGCQQDDKTYPEKSPLPVTTIKLQESTPVSQRLYSGTVQSWETEDIAFEVNGRVEWVVEPGTTLEGPKFGTDGTVLSQGTQIAQLKRGRFETALTSANAKVEIESKRRESLKIQEENSLPAEIEAAKFQYELAAKDRKRIQSLVEQGAGSAKDLDLAQASESAAKAALDGLKARLLQASADVKAADAAREQAEQGVREAEINLDDTRLHATFPGQVSDVHVVAGSLAGPGTAVATVQMMNPIKVEVEVSADKSRDLHRGDKLNLSLIMADGQHQQADATVYAVAPSADKLTRTFTLTLLVVNKELEVELPDDAAPDSLAVTRNLWRVGLQILPPAPAGTFYMPESGMHTDTTGTYVWRVTNLQAGESVKGLLRVSKFYVEPGEVRVPLLGRSYFRTVTVLPDQEFDPELDLFAMNVLVDDKRVENWDGNTMVLGSDRRWILRPGDLVQVDLSDQPSGPGIYVPADSITEESGHAFVFRLDGDTVRKTEVKLLDVAGQSLHRIEAVKKEIDLLGQKIVSEGVHYLVDGQQVVVIEPGAAR